MSTQTESVQQLIRQEVVIDGLVSPKRQDDPDFYIEMRDAGLSAVNWTVAAFANFRGTVKKITEWNARLERFSDRAFLCTTARQIEEAKSQGKVGIIYGFQNTTPLEDEVAFVDVFHRLGVRIIQLTYNERNLVGDGCAERTNCGLSHFGVEVVQEMNRLGVVVDVSHVGYRTALDAVEVSRKPVIASHSNPKALRDVRRNIPDELISAIAEKGGVVGVVAFPGFISDKSQPTLDDLLVHLDYLVDTIGSDHVSVGSDFIEGATLEDYTTETGTLGVGKSTYTKEMGYPEWPWNYPQGFARVRDYPNLMEALVSRYSYETARKILGGNLLRVFREVWGE